MPKDANKVTKIPLINRIATFQLLKLPGTITLNHKNDKIIPAWTPAQPLKPIVVENGMTVSAPSSLTFKSSFKVVIATIGSAALEDCDVKPAMDWSLRFWYNQRFS